MPSFPNGYDELGDNDILFESALFILILLLLFRLWSVVLIILEIT